MAKETNDSRRKFIKTAGKFAVYAPPALMVMSKANANDIHISCRPGWETDNACIKVEEL